MGGTYKDLLEYLGISHGVFIIILILLFLIASFVMLLYKLGFLSRIKFSTMLIPSSTIVYTKYVGSFQVINSKVQQIFQQTSSYFKFSTIFAIYYDPNEDSDLDKMEAVMGVIVKEEEKQKIQLFLNALKGKYKQSSIPKSMCVGTKYPYFNSLSLIMIVNRVYPKLAEYVRQKKLEVGPGVIQIYHISTESPYVQILAPLENQEKFKFR